MNRNNYVRRVIRRLNSSAGLYPPEAQAFIDAHCAQQPKPSQPIITRQPIPADIDIVQVLGWPTGSAVICLPEVDYGQE